MVAGWGFTCAEQSQGGQAGGRWPGPQLFKFSSGKPAAPGKAELLGVRVRHRTGIGGDSWRQDIARCPGSRQAERAATSPAPPPSSPEPPGETRQQWAGSVRRHLHTPWGVGGLVVKHWVVLAAFTPGGASTSLTVPRNPQRPFVKGLGASSSTPPPGCLRESGGDLTTAREPARGPPSRSLPSTRAGGDAGALSRTGPEQGGSEGHPYPHERCPPAGSPGLGLGSLCPGATHSGRASPRVGPHLCQVCVWAGGGCFPFSVVGAFVAALNSYFFFLEPEVLTLCSQPWLIPAWDLTRTCPGWSRRCPGTRSFLRDTEAQRGSHGAHDRLAGSAYHQVKTLVFCLWRFGEVLHVVPRRCPQSR